MTGAVVGLCLGVGMACIWFSCWSSPQRRADRPGWQARVQDTLVQAGLLRMSVPGFLGACAALGLFGCLVGLLVFKVPFLALLAGAAAAAGPYVWVRRRARLRQEAVRTLWPDVVDNIASSVRAGLSLPEAMMQLAERGPEQLRWAFQAFADDYRATGRFSPSLDAFKDRLADPVADRLVEALRIAREVGGTDLGRLLRTLSGFLREDARTRAEIEARQSWTVNAARLALAAPWAVLAMLATRGESIQAYRTPAGTLVLVVGGLLSVVAYRLMMALGRIPAEPRILR